MVPLVLLALLLNRPRNYCLPRQPVLESLRSASSITRPKLADTDTCLLIFTFIATHRKSFFAHCSIRSSRL